MKSKIIIKIFFLILCFTGNILAVKAYTNVGGTIGTGTTWTGSGSPYVVTSDLTISNGITLTIEPGVVVKVKPLMKIVSYGVINAVGTEANNIYITAYDDTTVDATVGDGTVSEGYRYGLGDYWKYLKLDGAGSNNSILKYVNIRFYGNAKEVQYNYTSSNYRSHHRCGRSRYRTRRNTKNYYYKPDEINRSGLQIINSTATIDSSYIIYGSNIGTKNDTTTSGTRCRNGTYYTTNKYYQNTINSYVYGMYVSGGSPYLYNNTISNSKYYGMYVTGNSSAHIKNNTIQNNGNYGLYYNSGNSLIERNKILNNTTGGMYIYSGTPNIKINQIENNSTYGIYVTGGTPNINNNYSIKGHSYGIFVNGGTPNINNNYNKPDETSVAVITGNTTGIFLNAGIATLNTNRIENNTSNGLYISNYNHNITSNSIKNNGSYGVYSNNGNSTISNNIIDGNSNNGIYILNGAPNIDNNTISSNANGIYIDNGNGLITNNSITGNTGYGIISNYLDPYLSGANNTISGNGINKYHSHQFNILATNGTLKDTVLDIVIDRSSTLAAGKTLTLLPGNVIKFHNTLATTIEGTLISEGTSSNNIVFTSINDGNGTPAAGNWNMLKINSSTSNASSIKYSEFKYGTNALYLYNTTANVDNSTFENNTTGINIFGTTSSSITNSDFSNNVSYGVYVASGIPEIDSCSIAGGAYGIRVVSGNSTITNNTITGTSSNGIYFDNGTSTIDNNEIINNNGNGVNINNGIPIIINNTITGNTLYGLISTYIDPYHESNNNIIHSNGKNAYFSHYFDLSILDYGLFDFTQYELIIDRDSQLGEGEEISLQPGSIIKSYNVNLEINGILTADGTSSGNIIFTSINDNSVGNPIGNGNPLKGNWKNLYFNGTGANGSILNYVNFKYAGGTSSKGIWVNNAQVDITNSTIEQNTGAGIYYSGSGHGILDNNIIQNNSGDGVYLYSGNPIITNNIIQSNHINGLYINSGNPVITDNEFLNNIQYGIRSYNLQIRVGEDDVHLHNISTGNTLGKYSSNGTNILDATGTVDGTTTNVIVIGNTALASGKEVKFIPGSIIKVGNNTQLNFNGKLIANGTGTGKIVFTSINDDTVGEDLGVGTPAKGNWQYLYLNGAGTDGSILDNLELRYAGYSTAKAIWINNAQINITNSKIEQNNGAGIYYSGSAYGTLNNNIIQDNSGDGMYLYSGNSTITNNLVQNNNSEGIYFRSGNHILNNNDILNNSSHGLYIRTGNPIITDNLLKDNHINGLYINSGNPVIIDNEFLNNTQYGIRSYNLQIRVGEDDVHLHNTSTGNILGRYASNGTDIVDSEGVIDGSKTDVIVIGNTALASGKQVTFSSGSIIKVGNSTSLNFNGRLKAEGTGSGKVIFTSINDRSVGEELGTGIPAKGNWQYLYLNGTGTNGSILDNVELRYAGLTYGMGIKVNNAQVNITNSQIEQNSGYGIYYYGSAYGVLNNNLIQNNSGNGMYFYGGVSTITNNVIQNNSGYGIYSRTGNKTINNNEVLNNGNYGVYLYGTTNSILDNNLIQNNNGYGLYIYNGSSIVSNNEILGNSSYGLYSNNGNHTINNNEILNNGNYGIYLGGTGNSAITNNLIKENTQDGLYIIGGKPTITDNDFISNGRYGINSYNLQIRVGENEVNETNTSSGNTLGRYASRGVDIVDSVGIINGSKADVIVIGNTALASGRQIIFSSGSIIKVGNNIALNFNGKLKAEGTGTGTGKIIFTSINDDSVGEDLGTGEPAKGNWKYLYLNGAGAHGSILDNIELRYAGAASSRGIRVSNAQVNIINSKIEKNTGHGIYLYGNYVNNINNNIIRNNTVNGLYIHSGNHIIDGNDVNNNGTEGIYVNSGTPNIKNNEIKSNSSYGLIAHNLDPFLGSYGNTIIENGKNTYYAHYFTISGNDETLNFNVYIDRSSTLAAGKKLKLYPGTIVKLGPSVYIDIKGTLESKGLSTDNIIFTSYRDNTVGPQLNGSTPSRGNWYGLKFTNAGSNNSILEYTQIKYAQYGLYLTNSNLSLQNNLITESSSYGIYTSGGNPELSNTAVYNNGSYGIRCISGTPNIEYNLFYGSSHNVYNCVTGSGNLVNIDPLFDDTVNYIPNEMSPLIGMGNPDLGNHPASDNRYDIGVIETGVEATLKVLKASVVQIGEGEYTLYWKFLDDPSHGVDTPIILNQSTEEVNFRVKYKGQYIIQAEAKQGDIIIATGTKEFFVR